MVQPGSGHRFQGAVGIPGPQISLIVDRWVTDGRAGEICANRQPTIELSDFASGAGRSESSTREMETGLFSEFLFAFDARAISLRVTVPLAEEVSRERRENLLTELRENYP